MILLWLILTLLIGGVAAWLGERRSGAWPRWISLIVLAIELALVLTLWRGASRSTSLSCRSCCASLIPTSRAIREEAPVATIPRLLDQKSHSDDRMIGCQDGWPCLHYLVAVGAV